MIRNLINLNVKVVFAYVFVVIVALTSSEKNIFHWADLKGYENYFEISINNNIWVLLFFPDGLFYIILKIFILLGFSFSESFSIIHVFTSLVLCFVPLRFLDKKISFVFFYFCLLYWLHNYVQVRIALALSFFMISFLFQRNKNILKLIFISLSIFTHFSMFFVVLIYVACVVVKKKQNLYYLYIIALIFIILICNLIDYINFARVVDNVKLTEEGYFSSGRGIFRVLPAIQVVSMIAIFFRFKKYDVIDDVFLKMAFFSPLCYYAFISMPIFSTRSSELLCYFYVIFLSKYYLKSIVTFFCAVMFVLICLRNLYALVTM